jgi:hypothetical protein
MPTEPSERPYHSSGDASKGSVAFRSGTLGKGKEDESQERSGAGERGREGREGRGGEGERQTERECVKQRLSSLFLQYHLYPLLLN